MLLGWMRRLDGVMGNLLPTGGTVTVTYRYDPLGRRTARDVAQVSGTGGRERPGDPVVEQPIQNRLELSGLSQFLFSRLPENWCVLRLGTV